MKRIKILDCNKESLQTFLKQIKYEDIQKCCNRTIIRRGEEYYENEAVTDVVFTDTNTLEADVEGSENYEVILSVQDKSVFAECDCPFKDDVCKHTVAVLLFAFNEFENIEILNAASVPDANVIPKMDRFQMHLNSLSKQELTNLIIKFAPQNFKDSINSLYAGDSEVISIFHKTKTTIKQLFSNQNAMYNPGLFEEKLMANLGKIRGLWKKLPAEIETLILEIVNDIDEAFDEGQLYTDNYYDEDYFESTDLNNYVIDFVKSLSGQDKFKYINRLNEVLGKCGYSTFEGILNNSDLFYNDADLPVLKEFYLNSVKTGDWSDEENIYKALLPVLSDEEKEFILKNTCIESAYLVTELANFYLKKNKISEAYSLLKSYESHNRGDNDVSLDIYKLYLETTIKAGILADSIAKNALIAYPVPEMLKYTDSLIPDKKDVFEKIVEKESPEDYLDFLESEKRLPEAFAFIQRSNIDEDRIYIFFSNQKQIFPEEAEKIFVKTINEELKSTGDRHYHSIAEALAEIKHINYNKFLELLNKIKAEFNRRRNLIQILNNKFR